MRLHAFERRWMALISATVLPEGVSGLPGARDVAWRPFLDDLAARAPSRMLIGLRLAIFFVVVLAPFFFLGRLRTFAGLTEHERLGLLTKIRASRIYVVRELVVLLKSVACLAYCALPAVRQRMGLAADAEAPPWSPK